MTVHTESAFPIPEIRTPYGERLQSAQNGLTKREYAAIRIMAGFAANPAVFAPNDRRGWGLVNCTDAELAGYAAKLADDVLGALTGEVTS